MKCLFIKKIKRRDISEGKHENDFVGQLNVEEMYSKTPASAKQNLH